MNKYRKRSRFFNYVKSIRKMSTEKRGLCHCMGTYVINTVRLKPPFSSHTPGNPEERIIGSGSLAIYYKVTSTRSRPKPKGWLYNNWGFRRGGGGGGSFNLDTCTGIMPDIRTLYILHRTLTLIVKVNIIYTLAK